MVEPLRISTKILIIYGYMLIFYLFCGCLVGLCMYHLYQSWVQVDRQMEDANIAGKFNEKQAE